MTYVSNLVRSERDPKVLRSGPRRSRSAVDDLGRALGWFSLGLGLAEVLVPHSLTRVLGLEGKEGLLRAYGAREIGSGILSLSPDKAAGLWSRVAGDAVDIATLMPALRPENPKRDNARVALALVLGVTLLDIVCAKGVSARHGRSRGRPRLYNDRSGFPQGMAKARGAARKFKAIPDAAQQFAGA